MLHTVMRTEIGISEGSLIYGEQGKTNRPTVPFCCQKGSVHV